MPKTTLVSLNEPTPEEDAALAAAHAARLASGGFRPGDAGTPGAAKLIADEATLAYAALQAAASTSA